MLQRGPRSAESLSAPIVTAQRPEPPSHLDKANAEVWCSIVTRMPADWFPAETHPLLCELCNLSVIARTFDADVTEHQRREQGRISRETLRLLSMRAKLAQTIGMLSHKLRLTNVKRFHVDTAGRKARITPNGTSRPWDQWPGAKKSLRGRGDQNRTRLHNGGRRRGFGQEAE